MEPIITTTPSKLAAAFTEWERRYREEPARFQSDTERLATDEQTQGQLQAAYLTQILDEQKAV
jgi:hypothetical protein